MMKERYNYIFILGVFLVILGGIIVLSFDDQKQRLQEEFFLNVTKDRRVTLNNIDMSFVLPVDLYTPELTMQTIATKDTKDNPGVRDCRQYSFGDPLEPFSISFAHSQMECIIETSVPHAANIANLSRDELCDMDYIHNCQSRELPNGWTLVRAYYFSPDYVEMENGVVYTVAIMYGLQEEYYDTIVLAMQGNDTIARDDFQDPQSGEQISSMMRQQDAYIDQLLDTLQIGG